MESNGKGKLPVDEFNVLAAAAEDRVGTGGAVVESWVIDAAVVGDVTAVEVAAAVDPALLTSQGLGGDGICVVL